MTCVAVFGLLPLPKLALISRYPDSYNGPPANLTAIGANGLNASCIQAPSQRLGQNGTTIEQPGAGLCGVNGTMPIGKYNLGQSPPPGLSFDGYICYDVVNTTYSTARGDDMDDVQLQRNDLVTCVATYVARPKLALTSRFPAAYTGPTANLSAIAFSDSCTKIFSPRQDFNNVTVLQPGLGQCGAEGFVNQGQYQLNQTAPDGTTFIGWRCTDITFGVEGAVSTALFVQLSGNQSKSCVAEYNYTAPAPPPSPAPSPQPKLALISDFPASYTGPTANLSASSATATCVEAPSARFNTSNVTLVSPGEGLCNGNGNMPPGAYNNFTQIAPPGTVFVGWQCYAIDTVNGVTTLVSSGMNPVIGLSNNDFITCKANYSLAPSPKLALTSEFPPSYVGITSNITATSANNDTCIEAPSTRLNATANITILTPGPGFCRTDGSMPPGNYTLTQDPPPGVVLDRVECYDISNGTELLVPTNGSVDLSGNKTISCKMVYVFAASPSPSPSPSPQPRLALTSQFPPEYSSSAPTANLTATSNSAPPSICDESPSTRLLFNNVTISMPGAGFCNQQNNGNMPPGNYSLSQSPPRSTRFVQWGCYKVTNTSQTPVNITSGVILQGEDFISCVALYALVDPTCGDAQPGTPGLQPYNCSRSTMARNDSAAAVSPPSDLACCQPTCADTNITAPTAPAVPWICPANTTLKPNAAALFPPSNTTCCKGEVPFSINKTGPALVKSGQAFNFDVLVVIKGATTGVTITDDLPAGLVPGSTAATWTATSSVSGNPASGNCTTTPSISPEFTCNLGATTTWAAGDIIRVTVPVVASPSPGSIPLTNVANVFDLKNESASSNASVEICKDCGIAGECFDAFKTGPSTVLAGQAFDFKVAVRFFSKPAGPVTVNDTLPAGLQPTSALAAWKATFANGTTLTNNKCATIGNTFSCSLGADWTKGDLVEIIMPVVATAGASGNVVNRAVVTDGNLTKLPESPVIILPDTTGAPFTITKTGPSSVKVGEAFDYNLVVTFLGSATGVVVSDELPAQLTATSSPGTWKAITVNGANPSGECTTSSNSGGTRQRITCSLGQSATWAKGDRVEVRLPVIASASAQGAVNNTATITDNLNRTNEDSHLTVVVQLPGSPFTITKTGPTQPVLAGQVFNYNIIVSFLGPATGVSVRDQLPTQVTPQGAATWTSRKTATPTACTTSVGSPTFIGCDLGQSVTWAAGDTVEVTVPVTAGLNGAVNAINTAIVSDNQGRQSNATFPITINVDSAAPFTIFKAGPTRVEQNAPFNFEVTVAFMSSVTAARIVDNLPPGLWPTGTATWTATSNNGVPSGSCVTVNRTATTEASYTCDLGATTTWQRGDRIKLLVPSVASTVAVPLVNRATVSDNTGRNANASATVIADTPNIPQSVLRIDKTGPLTAVSPGQAFTFTIRVDFDQVSKIGPGVPVAANVTFPWTLTAGVTGDVPVNPLIVVDELPNTDIKFVAPIPSNCVQNSDQRVTCTWNESVGPGNDKVVQLRAVASKAGTYTNKATVFTTQPGVANQTANADVVIVENTPGFSPAPPVEVIQVDKKGPTQAIEVGKEFTFTLTPAVKAGPVTTMTLTDTIDASTGVSFVRVSPNAGCTVQPQLLTCTLSFSAA
ncbi:hypothetical protein OEZ85_009921 [Tetradesmus obliquus]|uniref:DUF11 domain-containing protein n=1 Tax=Tetradesmus obliquus TaxID=3088 RepID=A0ABY8UAR8_TETOB|nr:hypothetical protein OEZ85_009921 [Tetradesmus obliquus]